MRVHFDLLIAVALLESHYTVSLICLVTCCNVYFSRLYAYEVDKSGEINESLGAGIAVFQGLSNIALNCEC